LHVTGDYYGRGALYLYSFSGDGSNDNAFVQGRDDSGSSDITLILRSQENGTLDNALVIRPNGRVDINTTSTSTFDLQVNGSAAKPGGGDWSTLSDGRLKTGVKPFNEGLDVIRKFNPVWFRYNGKLGLESEKDHVGTVAQDLAKIAPYMVEESSFTTYDSLTKSETEHKYLTANYSALNFVLINAIKEQQEIIDRHELKIQELEKRIASTENGNSLSSSENTSIGLSSNDNDSGPFLNAQLKESYPNPSNGNLVIPFFVSENANEAQIMIYNFRGEEILRKEVAERGDSSIPIDGLRNGIYYYSLIVDNNEIGTKKMIVR